MIARASVLVVDDEIDICTNMADILGDLGLLVDTAQDGDTALEMMRRKAYDIALLDLKMPGMDGLELSRRIKQLRSGTVAIIVTAYANRVTREEAMSTGVWRVVAKPVDLASLLGLVEEAIDQPLVLIVDDDRDLCCNLHDLLRDRGYRVDLAHDEDEGFRLVEARSFQVVLIDLKLPGGHGVRIFDRVRSASPGTRSILITAHRGETDPMIAKILEGGAEGVCYKPFDIPELLRLIGHHSPATEDRPSPAPPAQN
jgi:two-component system, NtrC family, response regulator HydG